MRVIEAFEVMGSLGTACCAAWGLVAKAISSAEKQSFMELYAIFSTTLKSK